MLLQRRLKVEIDIGFIVRQRYSDNVAYGSDDVVPINSKPKIIILQKKNSRVFFCGKINC